MMILKDKVPAHPRSSGPGYNCDWKTHSRQDMEQANKPATGKPSEEPSAKRMRAAASMLYSQMQVLNAGLLLCLSTWEQARGDPTPGQPGRADYNFRLAMELAQASARTGEALARLKTGTSHHIKVERLAIPQETLSARQALKAKDNSERGAAKTEGEGIKK
jgi:hypothetical protein